MAYVVLLSFYDFYLVINFVRTVYFVYCVMSVTTNSIKNFCDKFSQLHYG